MTPEETIARGERARALWADETLQSALAAVKDGVRDSFFDLPIDATDKLQFLKMLDKARQQFENVLLLLINDVAVSEAELLEVEHTQARVADIQRSVRNG